MSSNAQSTTGIAHRFDIHEDPWLVDSGRDPATGLYSDTAFVALLNRSISGGFYREAPMSLALLQLANFYEIRTWVGGTEASLLLNEIATLLTSTVPEGTFIGLCHRHEFAILLCGEGSRKSLSIADRIKRIAQTCNSQVIPPQLKLQCAVGVVNIADATPNADVAFARARHNLWYQQRGDSALRSELACLPEKQAVLLATLRKALERNLLQLNFQATVGFKPQNFELYELRTVLIEKEVAIPANVFMSTAVQNALGESLDQWVIKQAVAYLAARPASHIQFLLNLTQNSLASPSFLVWLENHLANFGWVAPRLIMQISELDILVSQHHIGSFCRLLKRLGTRLSISHFGCTPNPLRYLGLIEADWVKLDHTLYCMPNLDNAGRQYLEQLIAEVQQRKIAVIAPMVEQVHTLPLLWKAGIDFIQGEGLHHAASSPDYEFVAQTDLTVY